MNEIVTKHSTIHVITSGEQGPAGPIGPPGNILDEMPQAEAEAGTSETLRAATARRIRQAIAGWWAGLASIENKPIGSTTPAAGTFNTLSIDTVPSNNFLLLKQGGVYKAIFGSEASIYGTNPDNFGTYVYTASEYFIAINTVKVARFTSGGLSLDGSLTTTGNVGVGTSSPGARLELAKLANAAPVELLRLSNTGDGDLTQAQIAFYAAGTNYAVITGGYNGAPSLISNVANTGYHQWQIAANEKMRLTSAGLSVTGGLTTTGNVGVGTSSPTQMLHVSGGNVRVSSASELTVITNGANFTTGATTDSAILRASGSSLLFGLGITEQMRLDASGHLLVGVASGTRHVINKNVTNNAGESIFTILSSSGADLCASFAGVTGAGFSGTATALYMGKDGTTNRSINAGGTINASGADYAEYERNNGLKISKGSVVGFKTDGTLTLTYSEAIRFGVKSTDPSYVGGDVWGSEEQVGKRPEQPSYTAPSYSGPQEPVKPTAAEADDAEYLEALNAYQEAQTAHKAAVEAAEAAHAEALAQYETDKAAFEERLEAARQLVDRIAYSGKVPVNVTGATPGGYIIAAGDEAGEIIGEFVADPDFSQYKKAVGRVNRILEDGRCEVAVIVH